MATGWIHKPIRMSRLSILSDPLIDEPNIRTLTDSLGTSRLLARETKLHWQRMEGFVEPKGGVREATNWDKSTLKSALIPARHRRPWGVDVDIRLLDVYNFMNAVSRNVLSQTLLREEARTGSPCPHPTCAPVPSFSSAANKAAALLQKNPLSPATLQVRELTELI